MQLNFLRQFMQLINHSEWLFLCNDFLFLKSYIAWVSERASWHVEWTRLHSMHVVCVFGM